MSVQWSDNLDRDLATLSSTTSNVSAKIHNRISVLDAKAELFTENFPVIQKFSKNV